MKKTKLIASILLAAAVALAVVSFIVLPDTVVTQLTLGGSNPTTMPKLFAIALPFALSAGGAVVSFFAQEETKKKSLIISGVGILVFAIMFIVNG